MRRFLSHAAAAAASIVAFGLSSFASAALFTDNFNTGASSSNYTAITTDVTSAFPTYGYDYSAMGIPSAPHSGDSSTLGVRLDANFSGTPQAEAVTLATVQQFTGDYTVRF